MELSVRTLDLVFHFLPRLEKDTHLPSTNLADSISDAAQSFANEEISHDESTEVRLAFKSFGTPSSGMDVNYVPGGLDTSSVDPGVQSDVDPTGISMFASMIEYLLSQFVTVVYPAHSSFRFKVSRIRYGRPTSSPGESTRTIEISGVEIAHCDLSALESQASGPPVVTSLSHVQHGPGTTLHRMDSVAATTAPPLSSSSQTQIDPNAPVQPSERPVSEHRPRSVSPSDSLTSSLFQSALMTQESGGESGSCESKVVDSQVIGRDEDTAHSPSGRMAGNRRPCCAPGATEDELCHRVILSLATEPIVVYITTSTPQAYSKVSTQYHSPSQTTSLDQPDSLQPNLEVSVSAGVITCALYATQIRAILDIISVVGSHSDSIAQPPVSRGNSSVAPALSLLDQISLAIRIRGFVLLLLQSSPTSLISCGPGEARSPPHDNLDDFFSHPLIPPKIGRNYVRFVMNTLKADVSVSTTLEHLAGMSSQQPIPERGRVSRGVLGKTSSRLEFTVGDLSACAFCVPGSSMASQERGETYVLPILLTDPFLSTQYHSEHRPLPIMGRHTGTSPESIRKGFCTLPEFEVLDWTSQAHRISQAKLSFWRVKPPTGHRRFHRKQGGDSPMSPPMAPYPEDMTSEVPADQPQPTISGQVLLISPRDPGTDVTPGSTCRTSVSVVPIHVLVDMGSIQIALEFLEILSAQRNNSDIGLSSSRSSSNDPEGETPGGVYGHTNSEEPTPVSSPHRGPLQPIHLQGPEELNLSEDYLSDGLALGGPSPKSRSIHRHIQVRIRFVYLLLTTKLEVKAPSHRNGNAGVHVNFAMVRIQLRCPSPSPLLQRSGAMVLDIHDLALTTRMHSHQFGTKTQLTPKTPGRSDNHLITVHWRSLLLACSSVGAAVAQGYCSIGPLSSAVDDRVSPSLDHIRFLDDAAPERRFAVIKFSRNSPSSQRQSCNRSPIFVVEADIPSLCLNLSKPLFDSLQFWIDDVTRSLERIGTQSDHETHEGSSRNPSLVGSRFFSSSKQGSVGASIDDSSPNCNESPTESIVKVTVSEGEDPTPSRRISYCV